MSCRLTHHVFFAFKHQSAPSNEQQLSPFMSTFAPQTPIPARTRLTSGNSASIRNVAAYLGLSLLCLLPCFWQERIQASDLSSHLYNAWLANVMMHHQMVGLHFASLSNNIEFDLILSTLLPALGVNWATRIAVGAAALLFFWSAFVFVRTLSRRQPWAITPWLLALTYGMAFQLGLFNFYISVAWSLLAVSCLWNRVTKMSAVALPLSVLAWLAHPLPLAVCVCLLIYERLARNVSIRVRYMLLVIAAAVLAAILVVTHQHFPTHAPLFATGASQLVFFSRSYYLPSAVFLIVAGMILAANRDQVKRIAMEPFGATYLLCLLIVCLAPEEIDRHGTAPFTFVQERLTIFTALFLCATVARFPPKRIHVAGFAFAATVFFALLYRDTATLNAMEDSIDQAIHTLPPYQRVVAAIESHPNRGTDHILDRACIGYCYSYANYEPATNQFRIRAAYGNPFVLARREDTIAVEHGAYRVRAQDLPLYEITESQSNPGLMSVVRLSEGDLAGADNTWKPF